MLPSLHAGLIERTARRGASADRVTALSSARLAEPPLSVLAAVKRRAVPPPVRVTAPPIPARRCALTLRVTPDIRARLDALRTRTDASFQQILHDAVTGYLSRR